MSSRELWWKNSRWRTCICNKLLIILALKKNNRKMEPLSLKNHMLRKFLKCSKWKIASQFAPGWLWNKIVEIWWREKIYSTIYKRIIGSFIFLTHMRLDILFGVDLVRSTEPHTTTHLKVVIRILRYIKFTTRYDFFLFIHTKLTIRFDSRYPRQKKYMLGSFLVIVIVIVIVIGSEIKMIEKVVVMCSL